MQAKKLLGHVVRPGAGKVAPVKVLVQVLPPSVDL